MKKRILKNTKENHKDKSGITLIALVVTIIVLLLLAGISISMLSGNNSILIRAKQAVDLTKIEEYKEEITLSLINSMDNKGKANFEKVKQEFDEKTNYETTLLGDKLVIISKQDNCIFEVNENGSVEYKGIREQTSGNGGILYGRADGYAFYKDEYINKITKIETLNYIPASRNSIEEWDASAEQDNSVISWIESDGNEGYVLYFASNGKIELRDVWNNNLFENFQNVKTINVSNFDVGNTTNISNMFKTCISLEKITGLNTWNTSKVKNMTGLFLECYVLDGVLDLSSWDISNVENFSSTFFDCHKLTDVIMPGKNEKATTFRQMFQGCWAKKIDISGITGKNAEVIKEMFHNYGIEEIEEPRIIDISGMSFEIITDSENFINYGYTHKDIVYVKNEAAQTFVTEHNSTFNNENVIIKSQ